MQLLLWAVLLVPPEQEHGPSQPHLPLCKVDVCLPAKVSYQQLRALLEVSSAQNTPPFPHPFSNPSSPSYLLFIFRPSLRSQVLREALLGLLTRLRTPAHPHYPSPYVYRLAHITPVSAHQTVHSGIGGEGGHHAYQFIYVSPVPSTEPGT